MIRQASVACGLLLACVACLAFATPPENKKPPIPEADQYRKPVPGTDKGTQVPWGMGPTTIPFGGLNSDLGKGTIVGQIPGGKGPIQGKPTPAPEASERVSTHHIDGKTQTLTAASFGDVRSFADLQQQGGHALGRFQTESASRLLPAGDYDLSLSRQNGQWRVTAASRGDGTVYSATDVKVQVMPGMKQLQANEVRKGSF